MQATLIYNPNATGASRITPDDIIAALRQAGYQPIYPATGSQQDLDRILQDLRGLVVVAGGDGSVRAVASRLLGNKAPLSILPLGAANNIARNLGSDLPPLEIIAGLKDPIQCFFDVGVVHLPWGVGYFLEAFGFGLYADALSVYDPEKGKSVLRSITAAVQALSEYSPQYYRMKLDGEDLSGHFFIVEALNTNAFGPRIKAAPDAHPDDGLFDVVRVNENERDRFMQYVTALLSEELHTLPSVVVKRGRKLEFYWTGFPVHLDAEVHLVAGEQEEVSSGLFSNRDGSFIQVENLPKAIEFWLPGSERKGLGACGAPRVMMEIAVEPQSSEIHQTRRSMTDATEKKPFTSSSRGGEEQIERLPPQKAEELEALGAVVEVIDKPELGRMKIDLHCHSEASHDCSTPVELFPARCKYRQISVQAITDHNQIWGAQKLKQLVEEKAQEDGWRMTVIVGEEISTREGEIIGLFLKEKIEAGLRPEETVERIKAQDGLVLLPHGFDPLKRWRLKPEAVERIAGAIDIVETFNARISRLHWNRAAVTWTKERGALLSAGSDAHTLGDIGSAWVEVDLQPINEPQVLLEALKGGTPEGEWTHPAIAYAYKVFDRMRRSLRVS